MSTLADLIFLLPYRGDPVGMDVHLQAMASGAAMNPHDWLSLFVVVEQGPHFHTIVADRWQGSEAIEVRKVIDVRVSMRRRIQRAWTRLIDAACVRSVFVDNAHYRWTQWRERQAEEARGCDLMLQRIRSRWGR